MDRFMELLFLTESQHIQCLGPSVEVMSAVARANMNYVYNIPGELLYFSTPTENYHIELQIENLRQGSK